MENKLFKFLAAALASLMIMLLSIILASGKIAFDRNQFTAFGIVVAGISLILVFQGNRSEIRVVLREVWWAVTACLVVAGLLHYMKFSTFLVSNALALLFYYFIDALILRKERNEPDEEEDSQEALDEDLPEIFKGPIDPYPKEVAYMIQGRTAIVAGCPFCGQIEYRPADDVRYATGVISNCKKGKYVLKEQVAYSPAWVKNPPGGLPPKYMRKI